MVLKLQYLILCEILFGNKEIAMKCITIKLNQIAEDKCFRNDVKFHSFYEETKWNIFEVNNDNLIKLSDVLILDQKNFNFEDDCEYKGIPTGQVYIDEDGDIIDCQIVTKDNHPNRLKYTVNKNNILLSSLRFARAPALNFDIPDLYNYVFSNGFYVFKVQKGWNTQFVYYLLRSKTLKKVLDNSIYRGIGISSYKYEDLYKVKIRNLTLSEQCSIVEKIKPINKSIKKLKKNILPLKEIIDSIISEKFSIEIDELLKVDRKKIVLSSTMDLTFNNSNHRFSTRWNKVGLIQEKSLQMSSDFKLLGNYIISTQNGWSPECKDSSTIYKVLGVDCITSSADLSFENIKFSDVYNENYKNYLIINNDFLVSRGNTTDLVALAAVAEFDNPEDEFIFPDLMIRVELSPEINKKFLAYIFNSFIGRLYFKYSSKGKNQTMVKISKKELHDFYIPLPSLDEQNQIVAKIKTEIDKQNQIKAEILNLRSQIDKIIEDAITSGV